MPYRTRNELESSIILNGEVEYPFIRSEDNWILSDIHNKPHNYLIDNCDLLKTRVDNLAYKSGLSIDQEKISGIPIWHGTHYISSGQTYVEALSVLDNKIKLLENMFAQALTFRGELYLGQVVKTSWQITLSDSYPLVSNISSDAHPYTVADLGTFLLLTKKNDIWKSFSMESSDWKVYKYKVTDIFGVAFSFEVLDSSAIIVTDPLEVDLFASYTADVNTTALYDRYLKHISGPVNFETSEVNFSGANDNYVLDIGIDIQNVKHIKGTKTDVLTYVYFLSSEITGNPLSLDRSERLFKISDIIFYIYPNGKFEDRVKNVGINIQGIDYISYFDIAHMADNKIGMVLADRFGNIKYRESTDGINWNIPTGATGDIIDNVSGYNFDYPTLVSTQTGGALVFYNTNYESGTLDYIHYALSRTNGTTWELPPYPTESLDIVGTYPKLIRIRNGNIYLIYHDTSSIRANKLYIEVVREKTY